MHVWIRSKISKVELLQICNSLGKKKKRVESQQAEIGFFYWVAMFLSLEEEEEVCGVK